MVKASSVRWKRSERYAGCARSVEGGHGADGRLRTPAASIVIADVLVCARAGIRSAVANASGRVAHRKTRHVFAVRVIATPALAGGGVADGRARYGAVGVARAGILAEAVIGADRVVRARLRTDRHGDSIDIRGSDGDAGRKTTRVGLFLRAVTGIEASASKVAARFAIGAGFADSGGRHGARRIAEKVAIGIGEEPTVKECDALRVGRALGVAAGRAGAIGADKAKVATVDQAVPIHIARLRTDHAASATARIFASGTGIRAGIVAGTRIRAGARVDETGVDGTGVRTGSCVVIPARAQAEHAEGKR